MRMLKEKLALGCFNLVPLLFVVSAGAPLGAQADARYDVAATKNVMVSMRDGVNLATDTYRPARNGQPVEDKLPAILMRTPYNKESGAAAIADYFVPRGYVVVLQ